MKKSIVLKTSERTHDARAIVWKAEQNVLKNVLTRLIDESRPLFRPKTIRKLIVMKDTTYYERT